MHVSIKTIKPHRDESVIFIRNYKSIIWTSLVVLTLKSIFTNSEKKIGIFSSAHVSLENMKISWIKKSLILITYVVIHINVSR